MDYQIKDQAQRAWSALTTFADEDTALLESDPDAFICDLITGLRHLADVKRLDWEDALRLGNWHYEIETGIIEEP